MHGPMYMYIYKMKNSSWVKKKTLIFQNEMMPVMNVYCN